MPNTNSNIDSVNRTEITDIIRWIFTGPVLAFLAITISGQILMEIPIFDFKRKDPDAKINFISGILNIRTNGPAVLLGFANFILILTLLGLTLGLRINEIMLNKFGLTLGDFEALCCFSSFIQISLSLIIFLLYNKFTKNESKPPKGYVKNIADIARRSGVNNE